MRTLLGVAGGVMVGLVAMSSAEAGPFDFDGSADYGTAEYGYYYTITGGKFPTGNVPNGDNASGGTFRFINDAPVWGYPVNSWQKDDWFEENAGLALTLQNDGSTVYDNNGIEDGTYGDFYNATAQELPSAETPGLYRAYSMNNVWDWIYAGYFNIEAPTEVDTLVGYFDAYEGFNPDNPKIGYTMNIWSNVEGDLLPTNTGSFMGDVLHVSTLNNPGIFSTSDTDVDRIFGADFDSATDDILRLTASLEAPLTLEPGEYWFSHSAYIVPEPATLGLMGIGLAGIGFAARRRRQSA